MPPFPLSPLLAAFLIKTMLGRTSCPRKPALGAFSHFLGSWAMECRWERLRSPFAAERLWDGRRAGFFSPQVPATWLCCFHSDNEMSDLCAAWPGAAPDVPGLCLGASQGPQPRPVALPMQVAGAPGNGRLNGAAPGLQGRGPDKNLPDMATSLQKERVHPRACSGRNSSPKRYFTWAHGVPPVRRPPWGEAERTPWTGRLALHVPGQCWSLSELRV